MSQLSGTEAKPRDLKMMSAAAPGTDFEGALKTLRQLSKALGRVLTVVAEGRVAQAPVAAEHGAKILPQAPEKTQIQPPRVRQLRVFNIFKVNIEEFLLKSASSNVPAISTDVPGYENNNL